MSATKKPLSLDAAINVLAFAFADPVRSGICASRMRVAAVRVEDELVAREYENDKVKFAKSIPKLLRAAIRLLTRKQSRAEYVDMVDHILCCRCDLSDSKIRALHYPRLQGHDFRFGSEQMMHLRTTVQILVWLLRLALFGMTKNKFRGLEDSATTQSSVKPWPYDAQDLLPSGFADTIAALTIWEAQAGGFHIFKLATALGQFYPPFLEALVLDPEYHFVLVRPLSMIDQAVGWFEKDPAKYMTTEDNADTIVAHPLEIAFQFWFNLYSIVGFLLGVKALSSKVIPVLERLRRVLPSLPATNHWKRRIKAGCSRILSVAKGFDDDSDLEDDGIPSGSDSEIELIKDALDEMTRARRGGCCHVFCPQTLDTAYARRCSKCDVLRYCGPECQKGAWKMQPFPHKALCSKIHALREQIGPESWPTLSEEGVTMRKFLTLPKSKEPDLLNVKQI